MQGLYNNLCILNKGFMEKKRADIVLCEKGLAESRTRARALIKNGSAFVDGRVIEKPSELLDGDSVFTLSEDAMEYVSRAALKLETAIDSFGVSPKGLTVADIGASTGGFTQCLLNHGAEKVFAVDVGKDQLHHTLRSNPSVVSMEGVNARELTAESFPCKIDMAVMDVSFISQTLIYPALASILEKGAYLIALVKPQFEVGKENVGKKGVVKDKKGALIEMVTLKIQYAAEDNGFELLQVIDSPIKGGTGNKEYLALLRKTV